MGAMHDLEQTTRRQIMLCGHVDARQVLFSPIVMRKVVDGLIPRTPVTNPFISPPAGMYDPLSFFSLRVVEYYKNRAP
jgi:hypothetical protein